MTLSISPATRFEKFIQEKKYLQNVSPATVRWYTSALKWLPCEQPTQDELNSMVIRMREAGLKATGCNAAIRAINCYLRWVGSKGHLKPLQEPEFIPPMFTVAQITSILRFRPRTFYEKRVHLLLLALLDTGARISEILSLKVSDLNFDDLLITLMGKGRKQRLVPMSAELRRALYRYTAGKSAHENILSTRDGRPFTRQMALRAVKAFCRRKLNFEPPTRTLHATRSTFAVNYIRRGGSLFHLQKILGHTSLEMCRRYANLLTEDLQAVHEKMSLLNM
jgi:integrase/recombinase XerD